MLHPIEFLLFPDALGLDITGPLEVFNTASTVMKQKYNSESGYAFSFVAANRGPVRLSSGLEIVEEDLGLSIALEVSRLLVLYFRRPGSQSQFSAPMQAETAAGKRFAKLYRWLANNLHEPVSVEKMADCSAMSPRNFARVFKSTTGMTPYNFLETLRLDRARELMTVGNQSLDNIAETSGFGSEERLRRAFLRRFEITPSQYRLHFLA